MYLYNTTICVYTNFLSYVNSNPLENGLFLLIIGTI